MELETSQAMPSRNGGVGTVRRVVRVNGSAVGIAPAARWASAASAPRIRSRPGGNVEVVRVVTRSRTPAVSSARPTFRAARRSSGVGGRVPAMTSRAPDPGAPVVAAPDPCGMAGPNTRAAASAADRAAGSAAVGAAGGALSVAPGTGSRPTASTMRRIASEIAPLIGDGPRAGAAPSVGSPAAPSGPVLGAVSGSVPNASHHRRPRSSIASASVSPVVCAAVQISRRTATVASPRTSVTTRATGSTSPALRIPASTRASSSAAARPASARDTPRVRAGSLSPDSSRIRWVAEARSQRRSSGRRATCTASIRDSSNSIAAATAPGGAPGGGSQIEWAAWAHSWTSSPHAGP